jgi:glycosyltransferase involved in cell wall biosynthesis
MSTFNELLRTNEKKFLKKWKERIPKTISAVMIVKDEEVFIEQCLKSLYEYVDEIVVVDTGSTDQTKAIAENIGDKVRIYDFKWCDDFSAARNFANSKATGAWLLSVDADEVVTGLRDIRNKLNHPYQAIRINTRNYTDKTTATGWIPNIGEYEQETFSGWFPSEKVRFWRNDPRVKFEFPVHEVVEDSIYFLGYSIITDYSIQVHHYGRTRIDYEYGHGNKYYALLHKQFESGANDLRSLEQLATQAQGLFKWDEALKFWHEVLKIEPENSAAFLNIGHCHASKTEWDEALLWSHKAWKANPENRDAAMNTAVCEFMSGGNESLAEKICEDLIEKYPLYPLPVGLLGAIQKTRSSLYFAGGI